MQNVRDINIHNLTAVSIKNCNAQHGGGQHQHQAVLSLSGSAIFNSSLRSVTDIQEPRKYVQFDAVTCRPVLCRLWCKDVRCSTFLCGIISERFIHDHERQI